MDARPTETDDRLREECGVFGVFRSADAASLAALGLHSLQHRGQDAAGIATYDKGFHIERRTGLVRDSFFDQDGPIARLPGRSAVGHVRYATCGGKHDVRNIQPLFAELAGGGLAVAHNGHLVNGGRLRKKLIADGAICQTTSDSEMILQLTARSRRDRLTDKLLDALQQIEGGYAIVAMTRKKLIGARDPVGIRPLMLGDLAGSPVLASETCALAVIGAEFVREVARGEVVICTKDGIESHYPHGREPVHPDRPCIFEYVYFSRPDSVIRGKSVFEYRRNMGAELAKEIDLEADMVVPIPESGTPFAIGFAEQSKIPYQMGIFRNRYSNRTFIEPTPQVRELGARLKYTVHRGMVAGKRVALMDDSLVRGTTSRKLAGMMRDAGAAEVHMLVGSPPIAYGDCYGIDTPTREELLAYDRTLDEMREVVGADSLAFLSIDGLHRALGHPAGRNAETPQFSDHCFTGDYPTRSPFAD